MAEVEQTTSRSGLLRSVEPIETVRHRHELSFAGDDKRKDDQSDKAGQDDTSTDKGDDTSRDDRGDDSKKDRGDDRSRDDSGDDR